MSAAGSQVDFVPFYSLVY
jgi:hypothetical protein